MSSGLIRWLRNHLQEFAFLSDRPQGYVEKWTQDTLNGGGGFIAQSRWISERFAAHNRKVNLVNSKSPKVYILPLSECFRELQEFDNMPPLSPRWRKYGTKSWMCGRGYRSGIYWRCHRLLQPNHLVCRVTRSSCSEPKHTGCAKVEGKETSGALAVNDKPKQQPVAIMSSANSLRGKPS